MIGFLAHPVLISTTILDVLADQKHKAVLVADAFTEESYLDKH
jgi:hypothetical protein